MLFGGERLDVRIGSGNGEEDVTRIWVTGEDVGDGLGVFDSGRQANAAQVRCERLQSAKSQHQLITALGFLERMDFVDDAAVLAMAIRSVEPHITERHRRQARSTIAGEVKGTGRPA